MCTPVRTGGIFTALALFFAFHLQPLRCVAAPGDLDPSFNGTGKIKIGFGGGLASANAATVQPDGKLVIAGSGNGQYPSGNSDFLIARFDTNNALDLSFGDRGKVATHVTTNGVTQDSTIQAVRVQGDGKIVAAGYSFQNVNYESFALVRYNTNGSLDTTFGTNGTGMVFTDFSHSAQITAMQIEGDGKIVVAGFAYASDGSSGFALARYDTNGVLDPSFGTGGITITPSANTYTRAKSLMIESSGKFVAVGTGIGSGDFGVDFAMFCYTTNGVLDSTFGGGTGKVFTRVSPTAFDYTDSAAGVATQFGNDTLSNPDKIVVCGTYEDENVFPSQFYLTVIRYKLDGTLDGSFGNGGIVTNALTTWSGGVVGLSVQGFLSQPRKITVGGWVYDRTNSYYFLDRFTATGTLDSSFGTNSSGTVKFVVLQDPTGFNSANASAMTLQSGGFVEVGSRAVFEQGSGFAAARFTSSGLVDTNFGTNGLLLADVSDASAHANAVAIQSDGKVVVAGAASTGGYNAVNRFALARFNPDGSPDASFGINGALASTITTNDIIQALAIQPDGKIIAAGSSYNMFTVARYNTDGSPDGSFGINGVTLTSLGTGSGGANAVQIQSDGKIVLAGFASDGSAQHFALARYNTYGALDTNFGSAGKVITPISTADIAYAAGLQSNGKIVLGGLAASVSGATLSANFAATRYNTNGAADFSFGTLGRAQENAGGGTLDAGYAMVIQPDGKIILAGAAGVGNIPGPVSQNMPVNSFVSLIRFNTNGTPDTSFGNSGSVITEVGAFSDFATSVALQPDGKILVAGASQNGLYKFFALRYLADGSSVDQSYGIDGAAPVDFGSGSNEVAYAMALDSSGRAVLAGDAGGLFGLARLQGDFVVGPQLKISLASPNALVVSWPYPSTGWNLQQNTSLTAGSWSAPAQTINNDGTNNFIVVSPVSGSAFFRLISP